jgi:hypothetical protein
VPFIYLASHGLDLVVLSTALFIRGAGQGAVGVPSISAAYASVNPHDLPMATTSLNVVQRLGGPTFTTLCATFLAWRLNSPPMHQTVLNPYASAFLLLGALHGLLLVGAMRLPSR